VKPEPQTLNPGLNQTQTPKPSQGYCSAAILEEMMTTQEAALGSRSQMSESNFRMQWQNAMSTPFYVSMSTPICLSMSTPIYLSMSTPFCLSMSTPFCLSMSTPFCLSMQAEGQRQKTEAQITEQAHSTSSGTALTHSTIIYYHVICYNVIY